MNKTIWMAICVTITSFQTHKVHAAVNMTQVAQLLPIALAIPNIIGYQATIKSTFGNLKTKADCLKNFEKRQKDPNCVKLLCGDKTSCTVGMLEDVETILQNMIAMSFGSTSQPGILLAIANTGIAGDKVKESSNNVAQDLNATVEILRNINKKIKADTEKTDQLQGKISSLEDEAQTAQDTITSLEEEVAQLKKQKKAAPSNPSTMPKPKKNVMEIVREIDAGTFGQPDEEEID
jgi:hypothetical protein